MSIGLALWLLAAALAIGVLIGLHIAVDVHARLDQPAAGPGRVEQYRIRQRRRVEFRHRRAEFARTGTLAPVRPPRPVTW